MGDELGVVILLNGCERCEVGRTVKWEKSIWSGRKRGVEGSFRNRDASDGEEKLLLGANYLELKLVGVRREMKKRSG